MSQIYPKAEKVVVWFRMEAPYSQHASKLLRFITIAKRQLSSKLSFIHEVVASEALKPLWVPMVYTFFRPATVSVSRGKLALVLVSQIGGSQVISGPLMVCSERPYIPIVKDSFRNSLRTIKHSLFFIEETIANT
jgi:hypothetical protein